MSLSSIDSFDFTSIDPNRVYRYLHENGWQEEDRIDDRAAILAIYKNDKKYSVLLPQDREIPDFDSRMWDVFKTLELVENRSRVEIISALTIASAIALKKDCEILNLRFKFVYEPEQHQFPAKKMGNILLSLQNLFDAVGQAKTGRDVVSGKIQEKITSQTEISIFETFQGSFGIKLAFAPKPKTEQLDLFGNLPLSEQVSQSFLDLLKSSNTVNKENLKIILSQLKRRSATQYRKFLFSLSSAQVNLFADWGSTNTQGGGKAELSYANILGTIDFINNLEVEDPEEYEIIGELMAAITKPLDIEVQFHCDNKRYTGSVESSVLQNTNIELTIGHFYHVRFREITSINPATGEEKVERTVRSLSYVTSSKT